MITDPKLAVDFLATWLADYAKQHHKKGFVFVHSYDLVDTVLNCVCVEATKKHGGLSLKSVHPNKFNSWIEAHGVAETIEGIVVGPIDRSHGLYARYFGKTLQGIADVFPFFDLEYTDLNELGEKLFPDRYDWDPVDISDIMLGYCNHVEELYSIITNDNPPHTHPRWPYFLQEQKEWIAKIWEREKRTRHKAMTKPYPVVPSHICRRNVR